MGKRLIALIFGALAVGLIAGCGSSSNDSSTSSLTKAEFIKQGDAICVKHHKQIEDAFTAYVKKNGGLKGISSSEDGLSEFSKTKIAPIFNSQAEELEALGAPSEAEEEVNAILDSFNEGIEEVESNGGGLTASQPALEKANKLADEFGLKDCITS